MTDQSPFFGLTTPVPPPRKKRRRAITDAEKKELRDHWETLPAGDHKTHKALIQWFEEIHYHKISQSTVSEILSTKYTCLDNLKKPEYPDRRKDRAANWPALEQALNEWQIRVVRRGASVTGDLLKEMANSFWNRMPQYSQSTKPKPAFSDGWLNAFKSRYHTV